MKIFKCVALAFMVLTTATSCLKANLDELPTWNESRITDIRFDYKYYGTEEWVDGEKVVEYQEMKLADKVIDKEALTITCKVIVPAAKDKFTVAERANVTTKNLCCIVWLTEAARMKPLEGSPAMGIPGDWSKPNKYEVTAANGTKSTWTITVTALENN